MTTAGQTPGESADFGDLVALAQREHRAGRLAEAAAAYRRVLTLRPDIAELHNDLGVVLRNLRQLNEAIARFQQAIALAPGYAEAHHNLGNALMDLGKLNEAAAHYEQALALKPGLFQSQNNLGKILAQQGKLGEAQARYERAIAIAPQFADAFHNLGDVLKDQGKRDQAAVQYERALARNPNLFQAHNNLGYILWQQGKLEQAAARFERAIALAPDFAEAHNNLGILLVGENQLERAVARLERAIALSPDLAEAHMNLGTALMQQGDFAGAMACYDRALALRPDYAESHYYRTDLKTFRTGDADLAALETIAADIHRLPPDKMLYIHFALGKALEDTGEYGRAFEHLLQGNALKRREVKYDDAAAQRNLRAIADRFDRSLLDRFAAAGDPSAAPIFVLGMPRSGSTLVEQILASHPQVHAAGELKNLGRVIQSLAGADGGSAPTGLWIESLDAEQLRRLGQEYLASLPPLTGGKTRITDKGLSNYLRVGLIRMMLPNARIIHTVRDPVDTCVSCFSKLFMEGQAFSYDLAELGRYYRGYHELMAHWRKTLPAGVMLDVSYEAVVDNLEEQARRLIDFCGLPWNDRCLSFHETSRPIATASNVQVRRPVYRSSVARWRRYEAYLRPLLAELEGCR